MKFLFLEFNWNLIFNFLKILQGEIMLELSEIYFGPMQFYLQKSIGPLIDP